MTAYTIYQGAAAAAATTLVVVDSRPKAVAVVVTCPGTRGRIIILSPDALAKPGGGLGGTPGLGAGALGPGGGPPGLGEGPPGLVIGWPGLGTASPGLGVSPPDKGGRSGGAPNRGTNHLIPPSPAGPAGRPPGTGGRPGRNGEVVGERKNGGRGKGNRGRGWNLDWSERRRNSRSLTGRRVSTSLSLESLQRHQLKIVQYYYKYYNSNNSSNSSNYYS